MEDSGEDMIRMVLDGSVLQMQLNNIDWRTFDFSLVDSVIIFASESVTSGDQNSWWLRFLLLVNILIS